MKNILIGLLLSFSTQAANVIDLYGANEQVSSRIVKKYEKRIADVETQLYQDMQTANGNLDEATFKQIWAKRNRLSQEIRRDGGFSYVDIGTIYYPNNETLYTTIEVIAKNQPERLRFITKNKKISKGKAKHDLIEKMIEFTELETNLLITNQLDMSDLSCPVYHCVSGFHHPKLKPYLATFNQGVLRDKQLIIKTLNQDIDPQRRAAAAFLLGHFKDPHEIIAILSPHVNDLDEGVRNNVIRVISGTVRKSKIDMDPSPFIKLLDSPSVTDRNKSLLVLITLSKSSTGKTQIIQQGGEHLLKLLALRQPNNHDEAYLILKNISGQDLGEHNITGWRKWLVTHA